MKLASLHVCVCVCVCVGGLVGVWVCVGVGGWVWMGGWVGVTRRFSKERVFVCVCSKVVVK